MQTERVPHPAQRLASPVRSRPATDAAATTAAAARERAAHLVQSVAATIDGILSNDSEEFLAKNRQTGGQ